jgi:hypothetical protein
MENKPVKIYGGYIRVYNNNQVIAVGADLGNTISYSIPKLFMRDGEILVSKMDSSLGYFKPEEGVVGDYLKDDKEFIYYTNSPTILKEIIEMVYRDKDMSEITSTLLNKLILVKQGGKE